MQALQLPLSHSDAQLMKTLNQTGCWQEQVIPLGKVKGFFLTRIAHAGVHPQGDLPCRPHDQIGLSQVLLRLLFANRNRLRRLNGHIPLDHLEGNMVDQCFSRWQCEPLALRCFLQLHEIVNPKPIRSRVIHHEGPWTLVRPNEPALALQPFVGGHGRL